MTPADWLTGWAAAWEALWLAIAEGRSQPPREMGEGPLP